MVLQSVALLLLFFEEYEVYYFVQQLINDSLKLFGADGDGLRQLRWHFTLTQSDFIKSAKSFIELAVARSSEF
jgi:hypothetical protein